MYIHIGGDITLPADKIIGIFDMDNTTVSKHTRKYLAQRTKNGEVVNVSLELPKSFVVCSSNNKKTVYISQLSPKTLLKRKNFLKYL